MHIFDESIEDPFENTVCKENYAVYETLPVVDGFLFSGNHIRSGIYFTDKETGKELTYDEMIFEDKSNGKCKIKFVSSDYDVIFELSENKVTILGGKDFVLENKIGIKSEFMPKVCNIDDSELVLCYKDIKYSVQLLCGEFANERTIVSQNGEIKAVFNLL